MKILGLGKREHLRAAIGALPLTGAPDSDAGQYLREHFDEAWPRLAAMLSAAITLVAEAEAGAAGGTAPGRVAEVERAAAVLSFCAAFAEEPGVGGRILQAAMTLVTSDVAAARYAAADVLEALGPALLPDLLARLPQGDPRVREALRVVGRRYPGDLVLTCRAASAPGQIRAGLAALTLVGGEALGFRPWEWAEPALRWVCDLMGERPELCREALRAVLAVGPTPACVEPAAAQLAAHPAEACAVLCAVQPDGVQALGRLLPELDRATALQALAALTAIGPAGHLAGPGVAGAMDADADLVVPGLSALAAIGPSAPCLETVQDAWPAHREVAGALLRHLGQPGLSFLGARTLPGLAAHAAELSDSEMEELLPLIAAVGHEASGFVPRLAVMLQSDAPRAAAAMGTLSSLGAAARVVAPQILACFTREPSVRLVTQMARIADPTFFDPLLTHLFREASDSSAELEEAMACFSATTGMTGEFIRQAVRAAGCERVPGRLRSEEALAYLIATEEPAAANVLHLVAAKPDKPVAAGSAWIAFAAECSFVTQRELARQALADRGNPRYDPRAYLRPQQGNRLTCHEGQAAGEAADASAATVRRALSCFVSSTYTDMVAEREALAAMVFPEIRALCEQRGVSWNDIDLRYGLALEEEAAESTLLPISLSELERAQPTFFIGSLGERYGWVPPELPAELVAAQPWLESERGSSLTELEFVAGALRSGGAEVPAHVYLRHSGYVATLPDMVRAAYVEPSAERRAALAALKERLAACERVVMREYSEPREFAELVLEDLRVLVDRLYPQGSLPALLEREAAEHELLARRRVAGYVGCSQDLAYLDEHADAGTGVLAVLGEAGIGKSSLLAAWALRRRESHPEQPLVLHLIGASPSSANPTGMLRRLLAELAHRFAITVEVPESADELRSAFGAVLDQAAARGGAVLVIDGLDQLEDRDGGRELLWLPREIPAGVRFVVSTLPGTAQKALRRRECPELTVQPLTAEERGELVAARLRGDGPPPPAAVVARIISAPQCAKPLYLCLLLHELAVWSGHARLDEVLERYLVAYDAADLFSLVLARCEADVDSQRPGLVAGAVASLCAARNGLSEHELLEVLGRRRRPLPRALWAQLRLALGPGLEERAGVLTFAHSLLAGVAGRRYLPTPEEHRAAHLRLADHFEGAFHRYGARGVEELPWQLGHAGEWKRLFRLLSDPRFLAVAWETDRREIESLWSDLARHGFGVDAAYRPLLDSLEDVAGEALWPAAQLLLDAGHLEHALRFFGELVRRAREEGDDEALAAALLYRARVLEETGDLAGALAAHREREELWRGLDDREQLAACLREQAAVLERQGRPRDAVAALIEYEGICRLLSDWESLAVCLDHQAALVAGMGSDEEAERLYREQESVCRGLAQAEGLQRALLGQATLRRRAGDREAALARLREAERVCRRGGHPRGLLQALENHVDLLRDGPDDDEAFPLLREEEQLCRELSDDAGLQRCLGRQADILRRRGEPRAAMTLARERERLCRLGGDAKALRHTLATRALLCTELGELQEALALHAEEECLCRELDTAWGLATSLWNQALIYERLGNDAAVARLCAQRAQVCRELGDEAVLARTLDKQAAALTALGDAGAALRVGLELERLLRALGDVEGLERCLDREAGILFTQGRYGTAEPLYREQEQLCRRLGNTRELLVSLGNQALVRRVLGDAHGALILHQEHEQGCRELGDRRLLAGALLEQAETWIAAGEAQEGLRCGREAERLFRAVGDLVGARDALRCRERAHDAGGEWRQALAVAAERRAVCDELGDRRGQALAMADAALLLTKLGRAADGLELACEAQEIAASGAADDARHQTQAVLAWLTTAEALRASTPETGAACSTARAASSTSP